jgi:hypothetical protein
MVSQIELEFRAARGGQTQNEKLAGYLAARPGVWLAMPELAKVITPTGIGAAVHSRVADCRKKFGMVIEHKGGRNRGTGLSESWYLYAGQRDDQSAITNPG